jgi:hypothetical protein
MRKASHKRIPLEAIVFAAGLIIVIAVSAMGESTLIMPMGVSQSVADDLYVNETGDAGMTGDHDYTLADQIVCPNGTKTAPGVAFSDGTNWDTGIYAECAKGDCILRMTVNDAEVANFDNVTATYLLGLNSDGSTFLGDNIGTDLVNIRSVHGINYQPSSDVDTSVATVEVTGAPEIFWDESDDEFESTHNFAAPNILTIKSGTVSGASFAGNPKIFTVTFGTAFPDTNYSVSVISEESRSWTFQSKLAGSFVMNSNANLALTLNVDWTATAHYDP